MTGALSPNPKRQKLGREEVCIVLHNHGDYDVHIMDVKKKEQEGPVFAAIGFNGNYPYGMAFALLNSTLYAFGGYGGWECNPNWVLESRCIDLSPYREATETSFVDFDCFKTPMACSKVCPRAVLIGDDRICVFSSFLQPSGSNFEVYNPGTDKWSLVPEPPIEYPNSSKDSLCEIQFYFVENSCLYVSMEKGAYRIDFSRPGCLEWTNYDVPPCLKSSFLPQPCLKDDDLFVGPGFVYNLSSPEMAPLVFASASQGERVFYPKERAILSLPKKENERLRACIVQTGTFVRFKYDDDEDNPSVDRYLRLSFANFHHQLSPTLLNSSTFHLDNFMNCSGFEIAGLFYMS